ncbi:hypothetical protein L1987_59829 [Smallanthus sonchifolius]|uniref:Uncharacterized protein n=1 Tax=Smallanthus sonchifolius TaxID=185202 RepID=A0ACB9D6C2_9ASTR|nr:hypothetical protein L1987_59829 [Smallanthus sonchifolius]
MNPGGVTRPHAPLPSFFSGKPNHQPTAVSAIHHHDHRTPSSSAPPPPVHHHTVIRYGVVVFPGQKRARLGEAQHEGDTAAGEGQPNATPPPPPPLYPHQLLSFAPGTSEHDRLARMVSAPLHASRTIDWPLMCQLGVRERLLPPCWRQLLDVPREKYVEFTLEFFSTFRLHRADLTAATTVEFSMGGILHQMSISQFASWIRLYTEAEVSLPIFTDSLRTVTTRSRPLQTGSGA